MTAAKKARPSEDRDDRASIGQRNVQAHALSEQGKTVLRTRRKRKELAKFFANLKPCLIGMKPEGRALLGTEAGRA